MAKSQNSFIKAQKEKKRAQKKKEKEEKKQERRENNLKGGELSDMMAYVDNYGNVISGSPDDSPVEDKKEEDKKES